MRSEALSTLITAALLVPALVCQGGEDNTVTFDNQSGQPAFVKLVGPSPGEIGVPSGETRSLSAEPGRYHIKIRYGATGNFTFAKGEDFAVVQTATSRSVVSLTLHKVIGGNYNSHPIAAEEYAAEQAVQQAPSPTAAKVPPAAIPMLLSKKPVPFGKITDQFPVTLAIQGVSQEEDDTVISVKVTPEAADKDNLDVVGVYLIDECKQVSPLEALALCNRLSLFAGASGGCFYSTILRGGDNHIPEYRVFQARGEPEDHDYLGQIMILSGTSRTRGEGGTLIIRMPHSHPCLFFRQKGKIHVWMKKDKVAISNIVTADVCFEEKQ